MRLSNKKILIISPHPDDEMISCGGLIAKAIKEKAKVFVLYMAIGKCRQLVTGKTDEGTRIKEIKNVAKVLGIKYKIQFIGDEFMRLDSLPQKELIDPIEDIIQNFKPDIVVVPRRDSFDQDHRAVFNACITALRPIPQKIRHLVPFVIEFEEPHSWSTSNGFKPNFYIDISNYLDKKIEYYKLHKTQHRPDPFTRSTENLIRLARFRGNEIGTYAAEAYILHRGLIK